MYTAPQTASGPYQETADPVPLYGAMKHAQLALTQQVNLVEDDPGVENEERQRYGMLQSACNTMDVFLLLLHQYYSHWIIDKEAAYGHFQLAPTLVERAFSQLYAVFEESDRMPPRRRAWFARFPGFISNISNVAATHDDVCQFIVAFATRWSHSMEAAYTNKTPLLECRIRLWLGCKSHLLASRLFTYSRRIVGVPDGPSGDEMQYIFSMDVGQERLLQSQNAPDEELNRARSSIVSSHRAVAEAFFQNAVPPGE